MTTTKPDLQAIFETLQEAVKPIDTDNLYKVQTFNDLRHTAQDAGLTPGEASAVAARALRLERVSRLKETP